MSDEDRETGGGLLSEDPPVEEEGAGARPDPILLMWPSRTKMLLNPVLWTSMALVFGISSCFVGGFVAIISMWPLASTTTFAWPPAPTTSSLTESSSRDAPWPTPNVPIVARVPGGHLPALSGCATFGRRAGGVEDEDPRDRD